jgi:hypothetical protein
MSVKSLLLIGILSFTLGLMSPNVSAQLDNCGKDCGAGGDGEDGLRPGICVS